jgi:hypothetical protein
VNTLNNITTTTRQANTARGFYLRQSPGALPPEALSDLEAFFNGLRDYYDIPKGQPVYPPTPRGSSRPKAAPSKTSRNRSDHPWRGGAA